MKILKHSATLSLQVIIESKRISKLDCFAMMFLAFLQCIRERLLCSPISRGLYFRARLCMHFRASSTQVWGLRHPLILSSEQSWHMQSYDGVCSSIHCWVFNFFVSFTSSTTVITPCFLRRHCNVVFVNGCVLAKGWYHTRSFIWTSADSQIATR